MFTESNEEKAPPIDQEKKKSLFKASNIIKLIIIIFFFIILSFLFISNVKMQNKIIETKDKENKYSLELIKEILNDQNNNSLNEEIKLLIRSKTNQEIDIYLNELTTNTEKKDLLIKNIIQNELKIEIKEYIKDILKDYITNDFKDELKTEIKNQVLPEIKSKLEDDLNDVKTNIEDIKKEIKDDVIKKVKIETETDLKDKIKNETKEYTDNLFEEKSKSFIKYNDTINANTLQNKTICNTSNCIVSIQNNGKIFPNIIFTKGMIIAWFGRISEIPEKWAICDGTQGTPDLRNRFIIGSENDINVGKSGGNKEITITKKNLPKIGKGYFSSDSHKGKYHHNPKGLIKEEGSYSVSVRNGDPDNWGSDLYIDLEEGMDSSPIDIMNPYYYLFYIMKL